MGVHVVGGVYRERCVHPRWNEVFGSAGRAAVAIANLGTPVVLHSYMSDESLGLYREMAAWLPAFEIRHRLIDEPLTFSYLYDFGVPTISGRPEQLYAPLEVSEERVVRFGMLEGDAVVDADWAVYDPQNGEHGQPFGQNGSKARHLALVLNAHEAASMAGTKDSSPMVTAPAIAEQQGAEVVVVKMGPEGALVWTKSGTGQVPAFKTEHVWKIGSGDCFVAHFANGWMHEGKTPLEAAHAASVATAYYCETRTLPTAEALHQHNYQPVTLSDAYKAGRKRQVYLAGPFFDLAQVWMVHQARTDLLSMGLNVFSPYHDIGLGGAEDVVAKDLDGIHESDLLLAITDGLDAGTIYEIGYARALNKPVVVYSERHAGENLKMMEGSGCIISTGYSSALYATLWEALKI